VYIKPHKTDADIKRKHRSGVLLYKLLYYTSIEVGYKHFLLEGFNNNILPVITFRMYWQLYTGATLSYSYSNHIA